MNNQNLILVAYRILRSAAIIAYMALVLIACETPQNIAYFQNAAEVAGMALQQEQQFRLKAEDKINIIVNSADPMLAQQFTLTSLTTSYTLGAATNPQTIAGRRGSTNSNSLNLAYTVDEQGDITFPVLGKVAVAGKTRTQVADYIAKRLIDRELVKDPIVTVEYVNLGVNVLGEVRNPGHIDVVKDHFTILDALAYAGDLTINGERENVMVIRQTDGEDQTFFINLCDKQQMLNSPAFYLQQNDVVYVTPNDKAKRNATINGTTFMTPSFWISIASLACTITALILR